MKKLLKSIALLMAFGVVVPAMAGPDFQAIEQARKAKQAARGAAAENRGEAAGSGGRECPDRLVLPLDHGPRALTTPYLNEQRKARFEAQKRACEQGVQPARTSNG